MTKTLAAPLALLALSGCVSIEKGRQLEARIQRLEVQNVEQQRGLEEERAAVRERVAKVDQKIAEVQGKIDELNRAARRSGADLGVSLQHLQEDFQKQRGELEVEQHRLDELDKGLAALRIDTDGRFAALKGAGALDSFEARQRLSTLQRPDDKNAFFALAQKEDQGGDPGVARELYEEFVRRWPSDARAADAGFRAGQLLYDGKRYRESLLAFGKVAQDFPRSDRAPPAMLGASDAMLKLDMRDEARDILQQLIQKYPKTDAAKAAKERLASLAPAKKKAPPPPSHRKQQ